MTDAKRYEAREIDGQWSAYDAEGKRWVGIRTTKEAAERYAEFCNQQPPFRQMGGAFRY